MPRRSAASAQGPSIQPSTTLSFPTRSFISLTPSARLRILSRLGGVGDLQTGKPGLIFQQGVFFFDSGGLVGKNLMVAPRADGSQAGSEITLT